MKLFDKDPEMNHDCKPGLFKEIFSEVRTPFSGVWEVAGTMGYRIVSQMIVQDVLLK